MAKKKITKQVILLKNLTVNEVLGKVELFLRNSGQVEEGWTRKRSAFILEVIEDSSHPLY